MGEPYTCFNATNYGALLVIDPEEEFFSEEIVKIETDIANYNLSVIIFADWYNVSVMKKVYYYSINIFYIYFVIFVIFILRYNFLMKTPSNGGCQ